MELFGRGRSFSSSDCIATREVHYFADGFQIVELRPSYCIRRRARMLERVVALHGVWLRDAVLLAIELPPIEDCSEELLAVLGAKSSHAHFSELMSMGPTQAAKLFVPPAEPNDSVLERVEAGVEFACRCKLRWTVHPQLRHRFGDFAGLENSADRDGAG